MIFFTDNCTETEKLGFEIAKKLPKGAFVAMYGDLGTGKTAFVRGALKQLCPDAHVSSPTYTVMHTYNGKETVYHFDLYRITDDDDLYSTGFYDITESGNIVFCEWCENCPRAVPEGAVTVNIERICGEGNEDKRRITVEGLC